MCIRDRRAAVTARGLRAVGAQLDYSPATLSLALREMYMHRTDRLERRVRERLLPGGAEPDWLARLRQQAQDTSQERAAQLVGISPATLSQVLSGSYGASTARIERRVRGELMGAECECPVMGDVSTRVCQEVQERKQPSAGNPQHMQAWFACRGIGRFAKAGPCPHFNVGGQRPPKEPA